VEYNIAMTRRVIPKRNICVVPRFIFNFVTKRSCCC